MCGLRKPIMDLPKLYIKDSFPFFLKIWLISNGELLYTMKADL